MRRERIQAQAATFQKALVIVGPAAKAKNADAKPCPELLSTPLAKRHERPTSKDRSLESRADAARDSSGDAAHDSSHNACLERVQVAVRPLVEPERTL